MSVSGKMSNDNRSIPIKRIRKFTISLVSGARLYKSAHFRGKVSSRAGWSEYCAVYKLARYTQAYRSKLQCSIYTLEVTL